MPYPSALGGVFTKRRYTNPRLPLPYLCLLRGTTKKVVKFSEEKSNPGKKSWLRLWSAYPHLLTASPMHREFLFFGNSRTYTVSGKKWNPKQFALIQQNLRPSAIRTKTKKRGKITFKYFGLVLMPGIPQFS